MNIRDELAQTRLEEAVVFFKEHSDQPLIYKAKLQEIARTYEHTPAAEAAVKLEKEVPDPDLVADTSLAKLDKLWFEEELPPGAVPTPAEDGWNWIKENPVPFSGTRAHQSKIAPGKHEHHFEVANGFHFDKDDIFVTYVYLDPVNPPATVLIQMLVESNWTRVYWGEQNKTGLYAVAMGPLPELGKWVRLEVPGSKLPFDGKSATGIAFTLGDGRAAWCHTGKRPGNGIPPVPVEIAKPPVVVNPTPAVAEVKVDPAKEAELKAVKEAAAAENEREALLSNVCTLLAEKRIKDAVTLIEAATKKPSLERLKDDLHADAVFAAGYNDFLKAITAGAKRWGERPELPLTKIDGKEVSAGAGTKRTVKDVKDDTIFIEEKMGAAYATIKVPFDQLTPQSILELASLGLSGPEGSLKVAWGAYVMWRTDPAPNLATDIRTRLERARKESKLAAKATHLQTLVENFEITQKLEALGKLFDAAIAGKSLAQAGKILDDAQKEHGDNVRVTEFISERRGALGKQFAPGLWASYFSGDDKDRFKTYHYSAAETKLAHDWGMGSPDPRVPVDDFGIRYEGVLRITAPGKYQFHARVDDHLQLLIDGKQILLTECTNAADSQIVELAAGDHPFQAEYIEYTVAACLFVTWQPPGAQTWQDIPVEALWHSIELHDKRPDALKK